MEDKQQKREEVLRILQMIEDGKIDEDKGIALIAMLEGKTMVGGPSGVVKGSDTGEKKVRLGIGGGIVGLLFLGGIIYGLFFYLPVKAPFETVAIVYGLLGVFALCVTLIAVGAIGVGRLAVKKRCERPQAGEEKDKVKGIGTEIS